MRSRSAMATDTLRTIRASLRRFLSIAAICVLGTTMLVGLTIACDDLRLSADEFFDAQRLYDVSVQSTLGLTDEDVSALAALGGVEAAEGSWSETAYTTVHDERHSVAVHAFAAGGMNQPYVVEGALPTGNDEVAVTAEYLEESGKQLGDTVTFGVEGEGAGGTSEDELDSLGSSDTSELFASHAYTITATVIDPTSVAAKHGSSSFRASGAKYSFFVTNDAATSDAYSVVYLRVKGASELSGFSEAYDALVAQVVDEAEAIKDAREQARTESVLGDATAKVNDAEAEAATEFEDAEAQLADAQSTIDDALAQIAEGRSELASQGALASSQLAAAQDKLDESAAELATARRELERKEQQLDEAASQLPGDEAALAAARGELERQRTAAEQEIDARIQASWYASAERAQLVSQRDAVAAQIAQLKEAGSESPAAQQQLAELTSTLSALEDGIAQGDAAAESERQSALDALNEQLAPTEAQLGQWEAALGQIAGGRSQLEAARTQVAEGETQIAAGRAELRSQRLAAQRQLAEGAATLNDAEAEAQDGQAELDENRAAYEQKKADALAKIAEARAKVSELEGATWYVQDRSAISSYASIESDASSIQVIGTVFPAIFLTVAILVSLTCATRMVEEERGLIGLYKALGYSRRRIMGKYVAYTFAAAALGGTVGCLLGFIALPEFLFEVFAVMYTLPAFTLHFDAVLCAAAIGMFVVGICVATVLTVRSELAEQPALLMRPKAPRAGTRILLERIPFVWRHLSFLNKVTARNLFRYKRRLAMTVFGVAGCCALMICGFAIADTVLALCPNQYGGSGRAGIYQYHTLAVTQPADLEDAAARLAENGDVEGFLALRYENVTLEHDGAKEAVQLVVVPNGFSLEGYIDLRSEGGEHLSLAGATASDTGDGVLATKNAAVMLGLGEGVEVSLQDATLARASAHVSGIAMNYLGNSVYMTQDAYERIFGHAFEPNALLVKTAGTAEQRIAFAEGLARDATYLAVTSIDAGVRDFQTNFMLINYVVALITALAAGLSFVVLFTLSTTNISERERELATIKVLGFRRGEVRTYVNKELLILAGIGTLAGIPVGTLLGHGLTYVLNMPSMYFAVEIAPLSYVWSCGLSMLFAVAVCRITNRSLDRVDMVGALKSAE